MDSRTLSCDIEGAHVHVIRRENENRAWSKSKKSWAMPVDFLVVQAFDQYALERHERLGAGGSDFLLVNLFRPPYGAPMTTDAIGELRESLSRRAGLGRKIGPRMCRHAMASNVADLRRQTGRGPGLARAEERGIAATLPASQTIATSRGR